MVAAAHVDAARRPVDNGVPLQLNDVARRGIAHAAGARATCDKPMPGTRCYLAVMFNGLRA